MTVKLPFCFLFDNQVVDSILNLKDFLFTLNVFKRTSYRTLLMSSAAEIILRKIKRCAISIFKYTFRRKGLSKHSRIDSYSLSLLYFIRINRPF